MLNEIDLSRADLNLLVLFEAVLAERHVGRAAARLSLSPSAVSHGLARLRAMLNDPLFLKHPKGVNPTARALELAAPIAEILARVRDVVESAAPFDPKRSTRRFVLGMPDGAIPVILPPLMAALAKAGPGIDLSLRPTMPMTALADLDARAIDLTVQPLNEIPPRFVSSVLYEEEFIIAMRKGHALGVKPTLKRYTAASHILISQSGDPVGNVDHDLKAHGLTRRVALTVPNVLTALAIVEGSDLVAAVPKRLAEMYRGHFDIVLARPPLPFGRAPLRVVAAKPAMRDEGVAWLFAVITSATR
jgi:DNA-binding transcriptional LysR family regulator